MSRSCTIHLVCKKTDVSLNGFVTEMFPNKNERTVQTEHSIIIKEYGHKHLCKKQHYDSRMKITAVLVHVSNKILCYIISSN